VANYFAVFAEACGLINLDTPGFSRRSAKRLHHPKEVQYDEDDGDHDQRVNPTACGRKSWVYIPTECTE
jgi:hypothetical protein